MRSRKQLSILPQPDDTTCGPTCLHALYHHYGEDLPIRRVIRETRALEGGGTLAVMLGCHALRRKYRARIYTYNLQVFDPVWFCREISVPEKLAAQLRFKKSRKLRTATRSYLEFYRLGGRVLFEDLTRTLLRRCLNDGTPIITGLSSTYLYRAPREFGPDCLEDDLRGEPTGHFVVLYGYDRESRHVLVADPYPQNPVSGRHHYSIHIDRVIGAILLGILTYDANLLVIEPGD